jgi:hypothetical protein
MSTVLLHMAKAENQLSVTQIAGTTDPVLRNLLITQRYHDFALALRAAGAGEDATWCAFAVWASKTAGATIRGEVLPQRAQELFETHDKASGGVLARFNHAVVDMVRRRLSHDHLAQVAESVTADVSKSIADGNLLVFAELAPLFATLLEARTSSAEPNRDALFAALEPSLSTLQGTQDGSDVVGAFRGYIDAVCSTNDRAPTVLRANVLAVAHEQQRLQPKIDEALSAAVTDTIKRVIEEDVVDHVPTGTARRLFDWVTDDVCRTMDEAWDTALTETIMQLTTKSEVFNLRDSVPPLPAGMFPPELKNLSGTPAADTVAVWDRTGGSGAPSGAHDWADLHERMNFIVNLFRSRQRQAALFEPPFTEEQVAALRQGHMPRQGPF